MAGQVGFGGNADPIDIVDRLPASAAARLQNARLRGADAIGSLRVILDQVAELREEKTDLEGQLKRLQGMHRNNRARAFGGSAGYEETTEIAAADAATRANAALTTVIEGDSPQIVDLKTRVDRAFREMRRLKTAEDARSNLHNLRGRLVTSVEAYLRDAIPADCELQALPEPTVKLGKANILDEIESKRRRGRELAADLRSTRTAPITAAAAREKMRETIEALAARGEPSIERLMFGGALEMPQQSMSVTPVINPDRLLIAWQQVDAVAYVTWVAKDSILKRIDAEITIESADAPGLSDEDRANREAQIIRDMLATARAETSLVEHANSLGMTSIEHREDVPPLAFLNLELKTAERAEAVSTLQGYFQQ